MNMYCRAILCQKKEAVLKNETTVSIVTEEGAQTSLKAQVTRLLIHPRTSHPHSRAYACETRCHQNRSESSLSLAAWCVSNRKHYMFKTLGLTGQRGRRNKAGCSVRHIGIKILTHPVPITQGDHHRVCCSIAARVRLNLENQRVEAVRND